MTEQENKIPSIQSALKEVDTFDNRKSTTNDVNENRNSKPQNVEEKSIIPSIVLDAFSNKINEPGMQPTDIIPINPTLSLNDQMEDFTTHLPTPTMTQPNDIKEYWEYCKRCSHDSNEEDTSNNCDSVIKSNLTMEALICQACETLSKYFNSKFPADRQIPQFIFNDAKGVMFISYWQAGLVIGATYGTGVLISKSKNKWCGPCAISLIGCDIGSEVGIEKIDFVLVINDDSVFRQFRNKGIFTIGGDTSIAIGPLGKDLKMTNENSKSIYVYSFAKGEYLGISLESGTISYAKTWNTEFYSKSVNINEILNDEVEIPQNQYYLSLIDLLNQFNTNN